LYDPESKEIDHEVEMSYTGRFSQTNTSLDSGYLYSFFIGYPAVRLNLSDYKHLEIGQVKSDSLSSIMAVQLRNKERLLRTNQTGEFCYL